MSASSHLSNEHAQQSNHPAIKFIQYPTHRFSVESLSPAYGRSTPPLPRPRPHVLQKRPADARSTAGAGDVIQWFHPAHRLVIFDRHSCCFKASKLGNSGDFCSLLFHISQSTAQFFSILWPKGDFFRLENCHVSSLKGTTGGQKTCSQLYVICLNESFP
jgi:hypothetical protein